MEITDYGEGKQPVVLPIMLCACKKILSSVNIITNLPEAAKLILPPTFALMEH